MFASTNRTRIENGVLPISPVLSDVAKAYLDRGWSVIPLNGKRPMVAWKEFQSRYASESEVIAWFEDPVKRPSGLGVVTGRLSQIVVVDCDRPDDAEFWQESFQSSPVVVKTGGGGVHFYYAMPPDTEIRNRAGVFKRKIDIRGEGGYVAAPPSLHPCGERYVWHSHDVLEILPRFNAAWLIDEHEPPRLPYNEHTGKVRNAVAYIQRIHAKAGEGGHNATFRAACKLRDAGLSEAEALTVLSAWNETNAIPPWSEKEIAHKIRSAFDSLTR